MENERLCTECKRPIEFGKEQWYNILITEFSEAHPIGHHLEAYNLCEVCFQGRKELKHDGRI